MSGDGTIWTAPSVERIDPDNVSEERTALEQWLRYHRQTLLFKCAGLDADQLKLASAPPSNLTLLGLVRHMAEVERWWFRRRFAALDIEGLYWSAECPDGDFDLVAEADASHDISAYQRECELADAAAAGHDLGETFDHPRHGRMNLRWLYLHMIEEYARHNGHADLIRERIDGSTGD